MNDLALWIGIAGTVCTIVFSCIAYRTGLKKDSRNAGEQAGGIRADIEYIKRRTDDMLLEQRENNRKVGMLTERIAKVEASTSSAHKRIDRLDEIVNVHKER